MGPRGGPVTKALAIPLRMKRTKQITSIDERFPKEPGIKVTSERLAALRPEDEKREKSENK